MTTKTRIKNLTSTTTNAPTILKTGEFGYSYGTGTQANGGDRLYIGTGAEDSGTGIAASAPVIGGKYFVDMLDHVAGTLTADSAIIVDANSKIDNLKVDDLVLDGSTISSAQEITISTTASSSDIVLSPNENGKTVLHNPYINGTDDTLAEFIYDTVGGAVTGTAGSVTVNNNDAANTSTISLDNQITAAGPIGSSTAIPVITFNSKGQLTAVTTATISTTLDIAADTGTDDGVLIGTDTLTFTGGTGIDTSVSGDTVTFAIDSNVATLDGTQTLTNKTINGSQLVDTSVANAKLVNDSVTVGITEIDLGASATDIAGLTSVVVDDLTLDGSTISTTANNTNLVLSPHGTGTVTLPAGYIDRGGFSANSLVPKSYVDALAEGLHVHEQVHALVASPLATITGGTIAYLNGSSGVGATLTVSGATYDFADGDFDGVTDITTGDRVIINGETNGAHNGIYVVTSATVLTRAADFDTSVEMAGGDFVFVDSGTVYENSGFVLSDPVGTVGTDDVTFTQFSGLGQVTAGAGLTKTGNQIDAVGTANRISVAADTIDIAATYVGQNTITTLGTITTGVWNGTTVAVANGGTGATTLTSNGVILGNGTNALSATAASSVDGSILQADDGAAPAFSNIIDGGSY